MFVYFVSGVSSAFDPKLKLELSILVQAGLPDVIPAAAQLGDVETLRTYLEKNPHEVRECRFRLGFLSWGGSSESGGGGGYILIWV